MSLVRCLPKSDSGQALLIVLLGMTVILTVVLSVVSRTVTDITITSYEEDAQRAFDAAEAGIEDALLTGAAAGVPIPIGDATYNVNFANPLPENDEFLYPSDLYSGESATFWFVSHDVTTGDLTCSGQPCFRGPKILNICWGKTGASETPAVEVTVFYDATLTAAFSSPNDLTNLSLARFTYDPLVRGNNFDPATSGSCTIGNQTFPYFSGEINLASDLPGSCALDLGCVLMTKVKFFYNTFEPQPLGIGIQTAPPGEIPAQGTQIDSIGAAGDSTRRINVFQSYPELPFVFDSAIFGLGDLTK